MFGRYKEPRTESVKPISFISLSSPSLKSLQSDAILTEETISIRHAVSPFEVPDTWVIGEGKGKREELLHQNISNDLTANVFIYDITG